MSVGMLLVVILVVILLGGIPRWGQGDAVGYGGGGLIGLLLIVVLILVILGRI